MGQTAHVLETLKGVLRAKGKTYKDIAELFEMTEKGVRKAFADRTLSLLRVEEICSVLNITLSDLFYLSERNWLEEEPCLTPVQESLLASDERVFVLFHLFLAGLDRRQIVSQYTFDASEVSDMVARLVEVELIAIGRGDDIEVRTSRAPLWVKGGVLETRYGPDIANHLIFSSQSHGYLRFASAELSEESFMILKEKMQKVELEFIRADQSHRRGKETQPYGFFHIIRPWRFPLLDKFRRQG